MCYISVTTNVLSVFRTAMYIFVWNYKNILYKKWIKTKRDNCKNATVSFIVARGGHDPPTSWLWITRSNQLSYLAIISIYSSLAVCSVGLPEMFWDALTPDVHREATSPLFIVLILAKRFFSTFPKAVANIVFYLFWKIFIWIISVSIAYS